MTSPVHSHRARRGRRLLGLALTLASLCCLGLAFGSGAAFAAPGDTVVAIQFDDGISDQYQAGALLAAHGMHGTFFINSAEVGSSGFYMTWDQIHSLAADGNEIGGHTLHHVNLPGVTAAVATQEICDDRTALVNQGFTVSDFAYPYGASTPDLETIVQGCGYSSGRGVTGIFSPGSTDSCTACPFAETLPPADRYLTRTPENAENSAENTTTLADLEAYVTQAEQHGGGFVQVVFHHICLGCDTYSTPYATLDDFLTWLQPRAASNHTFVRTTREALQTQSSDTTPPTVALTAPADGATVSNTVTLSATASDQGGVQRVEFYQGSSLVGTDAVSPYTYSWDTNTVANGSHAITAKAFDNAGNSTTSTARTVTVANAVAHQTIVSLGFDDGDADQFTVRSMLSSHGMHATFYINSGRVNATGYMTLAQIQALASDGNEIAGHTVTHADLPTLDHDEAMRQVCNDRVALLNMGFSPRSFAYPYGDVNAATETIVQACGYNNARVIGGLVTPTSCSGCAYSETNPPTDVYAMRTNDSIKRTTTLAQMEGYVLQAEQHGGGIVPLVMHHVQDDCGTDDYCVNPTTIDQFLTWLQQRAASGTVVARMGDIVGGSVQPGVSGPPPPPPATGPNLLQNPSLETDANSDAIADCWQLGGFGTNTFAWTRSTDAHTGSFAESVSVSAFTDGDRRLITRQDLGSCSPSVTPGHTYAVSAWYKGTGNSRIVVYYRDAGGGWVFFAQGAAALPAAASYTQTTLTTPAVPAGATALSVGMSLRSVGTLTMDDFTLGDTDQTAPAVSLTAPADGSTVSGNVPFTANATDASGVARVDFLVNGTVVGSSTTAPYTYTWNSTTTTGNASVAARAVDTAGNSATSASSLVTVSNSPPDTTPPVSTATCDGGACTGTHAPGTQVALSASDTGSTVAQIRYTTDGSTPTASHGTVYSQPFALAATTTVQFRAYDLSGNEEAVNSVTVTIDGDAPTVSATCDGAACTNAWHTSQIMVALSAADVGSGVNRIVYTLDGSTPTAAHGTVYAAPFAVAASATVSYRAIDNAGGLSDVGTATLRIDGIAPATVASCNGGACSGWANGPVSVTLAATDADSGVDRTVYTTDGTDPTPASTVATGPISVSSTTELRFRSYDVAGNAEATHALSISVDSTAPVSSASCNGAPCSAATNYAAPLSVTLASTDAGSGVAQIRYTTDGSTPTATTGTAYSGAFQLGGSTTLTYRAFDVAGNAEAPITIALTVTVTPTDTTAPTTVATCSGGLCADWHTGAITVTLAATDDLSGVASTRYTTNGTDPSPTNGATYTAPITVPATATLRFRSYDVAGNAEAVQSVSLRIDGAAPTVTASCGGTCPTTTWSKTAVNVTLTAADTGGSGLAQIRYTTDGSAPSATAGSVYAGPVAVTGPVTLRYVAIDTAGNASAVGSLALRVDVDAPTAAATCGGGTCADPWYPAPLTLAFTASDAGSGVASIRFTTNGTDPTASSSAYTGPISVTSTRSYRFRAFDVAGNAGPVVQLDLSIDATLPTAGTPRCNGGTTCPTGWVATTQNVALSATDTGSGVARIVYTTDGSTPTKAHGDTYAAPFDVTSSLTVSFIAVDQAGNVSSVRTAALKVDITAPVVTITGPANNAHVTGSVTHITGTAQDNVRTLTWYLDGRAQSSGTNPSFDFSWNSGTATRGVHTIYVRATDQAGNVGQSDSITVTV